MGPEILKQSQVKQATKQKKSAVGEERWYERTAWIEPRPGEEYCIEITQYRGEYALEAHVTVDGVPAAHLTGPASETGEVRSFDIAGGCPKEGEAGTELPFIFANPTVPSRSEFLGSLARFESFVN